jgi:hypothetical protein
LGWQSIKISLCGVEEVHTIEFRDKNDPSNFILRYYGNGKLNWVEEYRNGKHFYSESMDNIGNK